MRSGPFVGRALELAQLGRLAEEARDGRPRVGLVQGLPGAGKSALLAAADDTLAHFETLRADAVEGGDADPMWLFRQLLPGAPADPYAAALQLLAHLAEDHPGRPVAIVVEDLHWVDAASQRALAVALRRLQHGDRVLGLVTSRPDVAWTDAWQHLTEDPDRYERIELSSLSSDEVAALAAHHGVTLSDRAAESLRAHTDGHPLHVRTLLGELTPEQFEMTGPLPAPRSLAASTAARVARLPPDAVALVAALAVVGDQAPLTDLSRLTGVATATTAVSAVVASGIVAEIAAPQPALGFTHRLHRRAVYDDLSPTRRRELHLAAARLDADPVRALWHRIRAADHADTRLADDIEAACADLADDAAVARLLAIAADLSVDPAAAHRRLLAAAGRAIATGDTTTMQQLRPRVADLPDVAERNFALGWLAWQEGDAPNAERFLRAAVATPAGDPAAPAQAWLQLGSIQALQSRGDEAVASARAALATGALGEHEDRAWLVLVRGTCQAEGGTRGMRLLLERHPDPWTDLADVDPERLRVRAIQHLFSGEPAAALQWFDAALEHGADQLVDMLGHTHLMRAQARYLVGAWDDALLDAHRAMDLAAELGQAWTLPQCHALAARVHVGQGREDTAIEHLRRSGAVTASTTSYESVVLAATGSAAIAHARSDHAAVAHALESLYADTPSVLVPMADTLDFWPMYVHALVDLERIDDARRSLDRYRSAGTDRLLDVTVHVAALEGHLAVVDRRTDDAQRHLAAADDHTTEQTPALDRMMLSLRYGRLLRSLGLRQQARDVLQRGRSIGEAAHAEPYLALLDAELATVGEVAGERRRSRFDLTDRERDVAALVGRGMTNKEIAADLFVSVKAVEFHLRNIYAKLGVDDRRALRTALER